MLEQQVLSTSRGPDDGCSHDAPSLTVSIGLEILEIHFQKVTVGLELSRQVSIHTLLAARPWHNPKGVAARLEQGHYNTLPFTQVFREAGLLA